MAARPQSNVPSFSNTGTVVANIVSTRDSSTSKTAPSPGLSGHVYGVLDVSGRLADVQNSGSILTNVTPDVTDPNTTPADEEAAHSGVVLYAGNNTTGVNVHQFQSSTTGAASPAIVGSIILGSGADTVRVDAGSVTGDVIDFGTATAGIDSLIVNGGAVTARILDGDGKLSIAVNGGTLTNQNGSQLTVSNLSVASGATLVTTIDPNAAATGINVVGGTATLSNGSNLGTRFSSLMSNPNGVHQYTILQTAPGALNIGPTANIASLTSNTPYLFVATPKVDQVANGRLYVEVSRRTAAQAGMTASQAGAYDAIYQALGSSTKLQTAFLSQTTGPGFFNLYNQVLPEHSGAQLYSLMSGVGSVSRALGDRRPVTQNGESSGWIEEVDFYARNKAPDASFRSNGFGFASGVERGSGLGALGVSLAFTSSDQKDPTGQEDSRMTARLVELGLYWRTTGPHWRAWARAAGGYAWLDSVRQFVFVPTAGSTDGSVVLKSTSNWTGFTGSVAGGVSYEQTFGRFFLRPEAEVEYLYLSEGSHAESGGGTGFDEAIGSRKGHLGIATAMLNAGGRFGQDGWIQPEVHVGYRDYFSVDAGTTSGSFVGVPNAIPFTIASAALTQSGPVVGFRLMATGGMGYISIDGDADLLKAYRRYQLMLRAGYRF